MSRYPERFIGFAYVSPLMSEFMVPELERAIDELGFLAIKIYPPYSRWRLNDPVWDPVYQFADDRGLAIISHTGAEEMCWPVYVEDIAGCYPNANFVIAHAGNSEPYRSQAIRAAQRFSNVYVETCSTFREPGVIERLVAEAGADRGTFRFGCSAYGSANTTGEDYYCEDWRLREASGAWGKCETPVEIVREIEQCRKRRLKLDIAN